MQRLFPLILVFSMMHCSFAKDKFPAETKEFQKTGTTELVQVLGDYSGRSGVAEINSVSFTPDSKRLIVSGSLGHIQPGADHPDESTGIDVIDVRDGSVVLHREFRGSVLLLRDGKSVLEQRPDDKTRETLALWDLTSGKEKWAAEIGDLGGIECISNDESMLAFGGGGRKVTIWDLKNKKILLQPLFETKPWNQFNDWIDAKAFSPDNKALMVGTGHGALYLVDLSGKTIQTFEGNKDWVASAKFLAGGNQVLTVGSEKKGDFIWNVKTGQLLKNFPGPIHVAVSPDGRYLLSGDASGVLRYWNQERGSTESTAFVHGSSPITYVNFSPEGKHALSGDSTGLYRYWNLKKGSPESEFYVYGGSISFSSDGSKIAIGQLHGIEVLSTSKGKFLWPKSGYRNEITLLIESPDGKYLLSRDQSGVNEVWNIDSGEVVNSLAGQNWRDQQIEAIPGHALLLSGSGRNIELWKTPTPLPAKEPGFAKIDEDKGFSLKETGRFLIASRDEPKKKETGKPFSKFILFAPDTGNKIAEWGVNDQVFVDAVSPDARFVVENSPKDGIRLLDIDSRKEIWKIANKQWDDKSAGDFSADGKWVAIHSRVEGWTGIVDSKTGKDGRQFADTDYAHRSIFTKKGTLMTLTSEGWVRLRRIEVGNTFDMIDLKSANDRVTEFTLSHDEKFLYVGTKLGLILKYKLAF